MERVNRMLLEAFALYLRNEKKEESTIKLYVAELEALLTKLGERPGGLAEATTDDLLRYRNDLQAGGMKPATINKRMSIARTFFQWAGGEGAADSTAAEGLRLAANAPLPIQWLSEAQERALLAAASNALTVENGVRNEALLAAMLFAGLRVKEVSYLRLDSLQGSRLVVTDESGSFLRGVPLDDRALVPLLRWRRHRSEAIRSKHKESDYLFVTERSGFMQPRAVQFAVESLSAKAGFPVRCSELRHTYCRRLAREGASVERIRDWAGHKSPQTTVRYFEDV
ncbi:tyrosine-type recombinase/integrase [Paenibacillus sp.]|uniref:tyrosine-type recombinase/integrase n=1 Tax=Paenibacillus sp. TaxID=58172 RepID=UPI002811B602|nr:tyrosine-type recombinase/integrase [Paenibacillus sp.]